MSPKAETPSGAEDPLFCSRVYNSGGNTDPLAVKLGFPRFCRQCYMPLVSRWHPVEGGCPDTRPSLETPPGPSSCVDSLLFLLSSCITPRPATLSIQTLLG